MSIEWVDIGYSMELQNENRSDDVDEDEEDEEEAEEEEGEEEQCSEFDPDDRSNSQFAFKIKAEPDEDEDEEPDEDELMPPRKRMKVQCDDCGKFLNPAYFPRHRASSCRGKRPEKVMRCQFCSKQLPSSDIADHYASCLLLNRGDNAASTSSPKSPGANLRRAKSRFSSRKVIDIVQPEDSNLAYRSRVGPKDEPEEEEEGVLCPECAKVFTDHQGRDEHLVYYHHYHFRIRFSDRDSFQRWFKGMRFDQIMYKANMSTVNGVTYEYFFCLHTAVNRRVRIRDRCPCRAFVKENSSGITVSYLDVHSHPQLKYKRYMTDECRNLILTQLEMGKKNKEILKAVRDQYSEASVNYTIARTTVNSIRFKYKKKVWAQRNVDIKALQAKLDREVEEEKRQMQWWTPDLTSDSATQTNGRETPPPGPVVPSSVSTREGVEEVRSDILKKALPSLEVAVRRSGLTANQLHTARVHLYKVIQDLNPPYRRVDSDHDYTYLTGH